MCPQGLEGSNPSRSTCQLQPPTGPPSRDFGLGPADLDSHDPPPSVSGRFDDHSRGKDVVTVRLHANVKKRLEELGTEMSRLREMLRILDEQVAYIAEQAEDAETRAIVASTPLADRERRETAQDLRRVRRQRDETASRLQEMNREQDRLLERLLDAGG